MTITRAAVLAGAAVLTVLSTGVATAQQASNPECRNLRFRSNFRLNGAERYLAAATSASYADTKARAINDAIRVLTEATTDRSADQATLWFLMGRAYAMKVDVDGADSAFTRAYDLMPNDESCRREILRLRANTAVPLQQDAVGMIQRQQEDSALAMLRRANKMFAGDPAGFMYAASIFMNKEMMDSAAHYFRAASKAGDNPNRAELRTMAAFNAARLYERIRAFAVAESVYREYLVQRPNDIRAQTGLAGVLQQEGRGDEALAIYNGLLTRADSIPTFDLFDLGVSLFRQQRYPLAVRAMEAGLQRNPYHRDALYNLTNTFLAAHDTVRELEAAKRLMAVDPHNRMAITLVAGGYQRMAAMYRHQGERALAARDTAAVRRLRPVIQAYQDSTLRFITQADSLPWEIQVATFEPRDSTATLRGSVRNLLPRELAAFPLTVEFVDGRGQAIASERVDLPALNPAGQPGAGYDFTLTASGRGILAYRYRWN
jgi:tetratricopeptide (TPR) repeat protein